MVEVQFLEDWGDYSEGDKADVNKAVAENLESKGAAVILRGELEDEEIEDLEVKEKEAEPEKKGPIWQKTYGLTQNTNISVQVWPPRQYDNPTIQLSRGQRDEEGTWHNTNITIPIGKAVELSERLKQAAWIVRDWSEEQKER